MTTAHAAPSVTVRPAAPERSIPKSILDGGKLPESIPLKLVVFKAMQKVPGDHNCESIDVNKPPTTGRYTMTYIARMGLIEAVWHPADKKAPYRQFYVAAQNAEYFE